MRPDIRIALLLCLPVLSTGCDRSSAAKGPEIGPMQAEQTTKVAAAAAQPTDPPVTAQAAPASQITAPKLDEAATKTGTPAAIDTPKAKPPEIPTITLANAKELVKEASAPGLLFMYHSKHNRKPVQDQINMFARESNKYPTGLGFRLLDLDSDDGRQIAAVLLKPHPEKHRKQITDDKGTGYMFYFPGSNQSTLLTYGDAPDDYVWPGMNEEVLEAYIYKVVSIKPTDIKTAPK